MTASDCWVPEAVIPLNTKLRLIDGIFGSGAMNPQREIDE
jgi:hypothetical protein